MPLLKEHSFTMEVLGHHEITDELENKIYHCTDRPSWLEFGLLRSCDGLVFVDFDGVWFETLDDAIRSVSRGAAVEGLMLRFVDGLRSESEE